MTIKQMMSVLKPVANIVASILLPALLTSSVTGLAFYGLIYVAAKNIPIAMSIDYWQSLAPLVLLSACVSGLYGMEKSLTLKFLDNEA